MSMLREKMIDEMKLRGLSSNTQTAYVHAVAGLAKHYNRSPDRIREDEVRAYLLYLTEERKLAWSSCNVAAAALRFFYGATLGLESVQNFIPPRKSHKKLPEVLSTEEVKQLFSVTINPKHRALLMTAYSGGLRVSEIVNLKVTDIDSQRMMIRVRQGKGHKDRYTLLSPCLLAELRRYWSISRSRDWLFPGRDPQKPLSRKSAQLTYTCAAGKAGITKKGGIHILRHAFATHLLEAGVDLHQIQILLGHTSLRTTTCYLHLTAGKLTSIASPLDSLGLPDTNKD